MKVFYNTTDLSKEEIEKAILKANKQNAKILVFFKEHPDDDFTPYEVHQRIFDANTPIGSIRRSITNLTTWGLLIKTKNENGGYKKRAGGYGSPNCCWQLRTCNITPQASAIDTTETIYNTTVDKHTNQIGFVF